MRSIQSAGIVPAMLLSLAVMLAASPAGAVQVSAGSGAGMAGQTVDVAINTGNLTGLGVLSYQFTLNFNGNLVSVTDVLEAGTLTGAAGWGDATFSPGAGTVSVSHAGTTPLSGAGTLLTLRFLVNPAATGSGSTALTWQTLTFNEGAPLDTTTNGSITVVATPVITVAPNTGEIVRTETLQFTVSGSVTPPVSWGTTNPAVATISGTGLLTGVAPGACRVFAVDNVGIRDTTNGDILIRAMRTTVGSASAFRNQSASVPVTVTDLTGLGIRSGQIRVTFNSSLLTATGVSTAGTLLDGYGTVLFGTTPGTLMVDFAGITDLAGSGVLCNLEFDTSPTSSGGTSLVLAEALYDEIYPSVRVNGSFTVNAPPAITVIPDNVTLLAGQTQQFTLSGSPTPPISWSTLDPAVATIDAAGLLTAVAGGVTKVQAVDNIGAIDRNTAVTVYDFRVWPDTVEAAPGDTVTIPILLDRNVNGLGVFSTQYTLNYDATWITGAIAGPTGLMGAWGTPASNLQSGKVLVAGAGSSSLGPGLTLHTVRLAVSPSTPILTNIPLTLTNVLFNEGAPIGQLAPGLLRIRETVDVPTAEGPGFSLARIHPNPARGSARFGFSLPAAAGHVRLAVYGVDGRLVRMLMEGPAVAGRHEVQWDLRGRSGERIAPGVYLCRLEWAGRELTTKFAAVR